MGKAYGQKIGEKKLGRKNRAEKTGSTLHCAGNPLLDNAPNDHIHNMPCYFQRSIEHLAEISSKELTRTIFKICYALNNYCFQE